jgi:hypothetical protein
MTTDSFTTREHRFRRIGDREYVCVTWFERDRQNVRLETPRGRVIFDLWDDDVTDAIESGCLTVPRFPRATDADWQPHAVAFARETGRI